jgi:hypothetical protein
MATEEMKLLKTYRGYDIMYYPYDGNKVKFVNGTSASFPSVYEKLGYKVIALLDQAGTAVRWIEKSNDRDVMLKRMKGVIREIEQEIDSHIAYMEQYRLDHATDDDLFNIAVKQSRRTVIRRG